MTLYASHDRLKRVNHTHEAIMQYLVANPEAKQSEIAAHFGYTEPYLSSIIHSHAFQDSFAQFREDYYGTLAKPIGEKLELISHQILDKLAEQVQTIDNPAFLVSTADKLLGRLGFGAKGTVVNVNTTNNTQNNTNITAEAIRAGEAARARLRKIKELEQGILADETEETARISTSAQPIQREGDQPSGMAGSEAQQAQREVPKGD